MKKNLLLQFVFLAVALFAIAVPCKSRAAAGDLYVADTNAGTVWRITPAGIKNAFATGLVGPAGLAFDKFGNLFVADSDAKTLYKFTPSGMRSTFASFSSFTNLAGIAFDNKGNLFVQENRFSTLPPPRESVITRFTVQGVGTTFAHGITSSEMAFDQNGNLLLSVRTGFSTGAVVKYTPTGTNTTFISGLNGPFGLAFDSKGSLFLADQPSNTIRSFSTSGVANPTFATGINQPSGLAFDNKGSLFVAASAQNSIIKFAPNGSRTTFATGFNNPTYLAFEPVLKKLRNISTRGLVQTGENVLIGGFIVGGNTLVNNSVVIRAIGPSLSHFGIAHPLLDPTLELNGASGVIASNNNWKETQQTEIQASGLAPSDLRESAIVATLPAGAYTAIVRGANNTTGIALVEVYNAQ